MSIIRRFFYIILFSFAGILACSGGSDPVYILDVSVAPGEGGTVSPESGEFEQGEEVEVTAEANEHWIFSSWEGDVTGTENPVVVTIESDMIFTATFEKMEYPLEISKVGDGDVETAIVEAKSTDYKHGTTVELTAVPAEGWRFVEWEGDLSGDENPETIMIDEAKNVTAVFERLDFDLHIDTEGEGEVETEIIEEAAKSDYPFGTVVELTAIPAEGWQFVSWSGDLDGNENPEQVTIEEEKSITAIFEREGFQLEIETQGEGSVGTEIVDDPAKSSTYPFETVLELTASPDEGWEFVEWQGDLSGSNNPEEITMDEDKQVTAVFSSLEYSLSTSTDGSGSIQLDPDKSSYSHGDVVTATASAADGWEFVEWQGDLSGSSNPQEITMDGDKSITAVFEANEFTISTSTSGSGSISLDPDQNTYIKGTEVTATANPSGDWEFDGWQGDLSGSNNPETFTVTDNMSITAVFTEVPISDLACYSYSENKIEAARDNMQQIYSTTKVPTDYHDLAADLSDFYDDALNNLEEILKGELDEDLFQFISTGQNFIQNNILTSDEITETEEEIGMYLYYELSLLYFYIHSCRDVTLDPLPQNVRNPDWGEVTNSFQQQKSTSLTNMLNGSDIEEQFKDVDDRFSDQYDNDLENIMNIIFAIFSKYGS